jgi:hypothetical protein
MKITSLRFSEMSTKGVVYIYNGDSGIRSKPIGEIDAVKQVFHFYYNLSLSSALTSRLVNKAREVSASWRNKGRR